MTDYNDNRKTINSSSLPSTGQHAFAVASDFFIDKFFLTPTISSFELEKKY